MKSSILNDLYDRFYSEGFSYQDVTSSHWRSCGWHKVHRDTNGEFKLEGGGFGDFQSRTPHNFLRGFGVRIELRKLAKTYACDNNLLRIGEEVARAQGRLFSFDCLKQVLSLSQLLSVLQASESSRSREGGRLTSLGIKRVCVIGDGYGYLGSFLKAVDPGVEVTSVNLGRGLFFDVYYTLLANPQARLGLVGEIASAPSESTDFIFLPAENYSLLSQMAQDLVLNVASMQEMNISVVRNYMDYIRPKQLSDNVLFYCCNRKEKKLPAGEIVRFTDYGWLKADKIYFDEPCPWYREFPVGLIPRYLPFDGIHLHRFVSLAPGTSARFSELKQVDLE